jgi:hypothetical protein
VRQGLPRLRRLHLPFTAVLSDVAGLRKVGVMLSLLTSKLFAVRAEFMSRFLDLLGHAELL